VPGFRPFRLVFSFLGVIINILTCISRCPGGNSGGWSPQNQSKVSDTLKNSEKQRFWRDFEVYVSSARGVVNFSRQDNENRL
jgi:hypothetical protein